MLPSPTTPTFGLAFGLAFGFGFGFDFAFSIMRLLLKFNAL
jgi:hypothetical protein